MKDSDSFWENNKILIIGIPISLIFVTVLWYINYDYLFNNKEDRGSFGDMFGAVNALFSGLAFAGIIITILLQRKELQLQREELQATRKEFSMQNTTMKLQRFENTFFNMLDLHHNIVCNLVITINRNTTTEGREVFKSAYYSLRLISSVDDFNVVKDKYELEYAHLVIIFDHYFRNLYRIIKFIDTTEFDKENKEKDFSIKYNYTSIVRAQLSDYELYWICYNCISKNGIEKFKPLVERYALLKNLRQNKIYNSIVIDQYTSSAFESPINS